MKVKRRGSNTLKIFGLFLLFMLIGASVGYYAGKYLKNNELLDAIGPEGPWEKALFTGLTFFAIWLVIALHELGHLTAGLAQGFRLALYTAGFLGIRGTEQGPRLYFNRHLSLMGGLAATFPEQIISGPELRRKFALVVVAGPLSSLALSIVSLAGAWLLLRELSVPAPLALRAGLIVLFTLGFMSAMIFLATSLPLPSGGFMTDGARFLSLRGGGENAVLEEAGLALTSLMGAGKLPGDYPFELLERLRSRSPDTLLGLNGHYLAFTHHIDRRETDQALVLARGIEDHLDVAPAGPFRRYYQKELVFFYAFLPGDLEKARMLWLDMGKSAEKDRDAAAFRARAALSLLEGRPGEAAALVEAGLKKVGDLAFLGQRRYEEKWLRAVEDKIRSLEMTATA